MITPLQLSELTAAVHSEASASESFLGSTLDNEYRERCGRAKAAVKIGCCIANILADQQGFDREAFLRNCGFETDEIDDEDLLTCNHCGNRPDDYGGHTICKSCGGSGEVWE